MQARRSDDLLAEIRGRIEKQPTLAVGTYGERGLAAWFDAIIPAPGKLAIGAGEMWLVVGPNSPPRREGGRRGQGKSHGETPPPAADPRTRIRKARAN